MARDGRPYRGGLVALVYSARFCPSRTGLLGSVGDGTTRIVSSPGSPLASFGGGGAARPLASHTDDLGDVQDRGSSHPRRLRVRR